MSNKPLASIIIPTYNRAHLITEVLDSIVAQTYTNWECIVVDDGSTDNTDEVLKRYCKKDSRMKYHHRPKELPAGGNAARNYGFELSKGDYVNWFDSDDFMLPEFLEMKIKNFYDGINFVICSHIFTDENLKTVKENIFSSYTNVFEEYATGKLKIVTNSVLIRKKAITGNQLFNEKIFRGQEIDFFSRLFYKQPRNKFVFLDEHLFLYRQHSNSKSTHSKQQYISKYEYSLSYVYLQNLKRGLYSRKLNIINYHYSLLIHIFYRAILNHDNLTSLFLYKKISLILLKYRFTKSFSFLFFGFIFLLFNRTIYFIEKKHKKLIFKIK